MASGKKWIGPLICGHDRPHYVKGRCQSCHRKEWLKTHKTWRLAFYRKRHLRTKYQLTIQDYEELWNQQEGKCVICNSLFTKTRGPKFANIDHDHRTGKIRGILCHNCNTGLGKFNERIDVLTQAIYYIQKNEASHLHSGVSKEPDNTGDR